MRRHLLEGLLRRPLTEPAPAPEDAEVAALARHVEAAARRRLGRSLSIREVDAGSCNGCELEIHALQNAFHDLERYGLHFVASPRHADVLLVAGVVTHNMREAIRLGDRVVLMGSAPGRVVYEEHIPLPHPRVMDSSEVATRASALTARLKQQGHTHVG